MKVTRKWINLLQACIDFLNVYIYIQLKLNCLVQGKIFFNTCIAFKQSVKKAQMKHCEALLICVYGDASTDRKHH